MLKVSTWNRNGLFMSLLEVSTRKPIMVFYYKTTKGFVSRTVWENHLRFNFETFITFSVNDESFLNCFITTCLLQFSLLFTPCNQFLSSKLNFWNLFNCRRKFLRFWMINQQHSLDDFEKMRKMSLNKAGARIWEICYMRHRNF